ncbi:GNAT family N-acetyltransferase [Pilimelia columellifera]
MAVLLTAPTRTSGYTLLLTDDADHVAAAQRLRRRVFSDELGALLPDDPDGRDVDHFDEHCDHLVVREDTTGQIVGTYRMLPPAAAARAGRRYADAEFDLTPLEGLRTRMVETGRSCVHPDHRSGAVINLIWAGIARYLHLHGLSWLAGCASVPLAAGRDLAAGVWSAVRADHLIPAGLRVTPRRPWLAEPGVAEALERASAPDAPTAAAPPLLRGYLRLGARVCGEPAYDPDFNVADLYVLLSMDRIHPRYRRHFLGAVR